jgi:hypothetical protein
MKQLRGILLFCLSCIIISLRCDCGNSPSQLSGGSEIEGKCITASNTPVNEARIFVYKIPGDVSAINFTAIQNASPSETAYSDINGRFRLSMKEPGHFQLFASGKFGNDSLFAFCVVYVDYIAPATSPMHIIDAGVATMRPPGSISGKVVFEPGFSGPISCYIPGSSLVSITDDSGTFHIEHVPAGTYSIYYFDVQGNYALEKDSNIAVIANADTRLAPKTLKLSASAVPPPAVVQGVYDTLGGQVLLSWSKVNVTDLKEYIVFRKKASEDSFSQIKTVAQPETSFADKVYSNPLDTETHVYLYELKSKDVGGDIGNHSDICSVFVIPPAWVRPFLSLQGGDTSIGSIDTVAVFDRKTISCRYANKLSPVDSLFWALDKPDSIIQKSGKGGKNGSDSLKISWEKPGAMKIYCMALYNNGRRWTDSIIVVVIADPPVVTYLSADTTVDFGSIVTCSLSVAHRFGQCSLYVDLDRDSKFEIKRTGQIFDTAFSTATDTLGGKIRIRITDNHHNVVDTFFTLTIRPAPPHNRWEECNPMRTPRKLLSLCVADNTIYAIGGCKQYYNGKAYISQPSNAVEAFDTSWTTKDTLKTARYSCIASLYDSSIYVFGGIGPRGYTKSIERYGVKSNTWASAGNMPLFRADAASCIYNNKLYVFGGRMPNPEESDNDSVSRGIYTFDFATNQWSGAVGEMAQPRYDFQAVVSGNKIFLIGGLGGASTIDETAAMDEVEIFDPSSNQCSSGSPMNSPRSCFAAVSMNDSIFVIGGIDENNNLMNDIIVFSNGIWREKSVFPAPHAEGRHSCGAGMVNGKIVIIGGGTNLSSDSPGFADGVVRKYYP